MKVSRHHRRRPLGQRRIESQNCVKEGCEGNNSAAEALHPASPCLCHVTSTRHGWWGALPSRHAVHYSTVSKPRLQKTGISQWLAGDSRRLRVDDGSNTGLRRISGRAKTRYLRAFSTQKKEIRQNPQCLADLAGIKPSHSRLEKDL